MDTELLNTVGGTALDNDVRRIFGGTCREDIDGGVLAIDLEIGSFKLPIRRGAEIVDKAYARCAKREGADHWDCLREVAAELEKLGVPGCSVDLAEDLRHRLLIAWNKKKLAHKADWDELSKFLPSSATGSED